MLNEQFVQGNPAAGAAGALDEDDDMTLIAQHAKLEYAPVGAIMMRTSKIQPITFKIQKSDFDAGKISREQNLLVMPEYLITHDLSGAFINCRYGMSPEERLLFAKSLTEKHSVYAVVLGFGVLVKSRDPVNFNIDADLLLTSWPILSSSRSSRLLCCAPTVCACSTTRRPRAKL